MKKSELKQMIKEEMIKVLEEGKYDYLVSSRFKWRGREYQITHIEDDKFAHVVDNKDNTTMFKLAFLAKNATGFTLDKPKKAKSAPWNKGQKTVSKSKYQKILKGAMKDAKGMGDEEFTHDMATSMIHDPEIKAYLGKDYIKAGKNIDHPLLKKKMLQRLQWDLEEFLD